MKCHMCGTSLASCTAQQVRLALLGKEKLEAMQLQGEIGGSAGTEALGKRNHVTI